MLSNTIYLSPDLSIYTALTQASFRLPFVGAISAGFPSPAADFIDLSIDLNKHLIKHQSSTFFGRVKGNSMVDEGLNDGDLLIICKVSQRC